MRHLLRVRARVLGRAGVSVVAAAAVATAGACARPGTPPGGPIDRLPPVVAEVEPDTFEVVEAGNRTIRLRFNERISERPQQGSLAGAVTVSPRTGELKVSHDRFGLDIEVEGGLRPGLVYRVAVAPVLNDMFNNPMAVPFEWVFTTGGQVNPNVIYGQVWDATTGDPVEAASVEVRRTQLEDAAADTFPYVATTDSLGIFVVRYLPEGPISLQVWQDINSDGEAAMLEPSWQQRFQMRASDSLMVSHVPLLAQDTALARLVDVEVLDSLTLRAEFDLFVDPSSPIDEIQASLAPATDSLGVPLEAAAGAVAPGIERLFHEAEFTEWADSLAEALSEAQETAGETPEDEIPTGDPPVEDTVAVEVPPADTLPADSLAADSLAADLLATEADAEPAARPLTPSDFASEEALELLPNGLQLPQRTLVIRLAEPLPRGVPFDLVLERVISLAQRAGGGGAARFELEEIEPEDPPPPPAGARE